MAIDFKSEKKILEVKDNQGELVTYEIEIRYDPLIDNVSIICMHLEDKWSKFYCSNSKEWLEKSIDESRKQCIFCPSLIDKVVAKFPESQMPKELYKNGDIYIFPNLFPRTSFEAVVTNTNLHSLDFSIDLTDYFYDLISSAIDCINEAYNKNTDLKYAVIGCNYLPPAGASLMHFHMQVSMQEFPFHRIKLFIDKSKEYFTIYGKNYWFDLINYDKDRIIAKEGNLYWYIPYAPMGFAEVRSIVDRLSITDFNAEDIMNLSNGICKILKFYNGRGYNSFNFIIYSGNLDKIEEYFRCGFIIVARSNYCANYLSIDSWYMPYLLNQIIILDKPEDLALKLREKW